METRTYHRRKARYEALARGENLNQARIDPAAPKQPTGTLDWFLEALER